MCEGTPHQRLDDESTQLVGRQPTTVPLEPHMADWDGGPAPGLGVGAYLHALRRKWPLAAAVGLICAVAAALGAWHIQQPQYSAGAVLRISMGDSPLVFENNERRGQKNFGIYKATQRELLKSPEVLNAALRAEEVSKLPVVQRQLDPVQWLNDTLAVSFPGDAEIMEVRLAGESPAAVARIVNSVVHTYLEQVVGSERLLKQQRLENLRVAYEKAETEVRRKRNQLKQLARTLGTGDSEASSLVQQHALRQLATYQKELTRAEFDLMQAEGELDLARQTTEDESSVTVSGIEMERAVRSDERTQQLVSEIEQYRNLIAETKESYVADAAAPRVEKYRAHIESIKEKISQRREQLRQELAHAKELEADERLQRRKDRVEILKRQKSRLQQDVDNLRAEAQESGESSIELEILRFEIDSLEDVMSRIGTEIRHTEVELNHSKPRVRLLSEAVPPKSPDGSLRTSTSLASGVLALVLPMLCLTWLDVQQQRISSAAEVVHGLRLNVLGALPFIPVRALRGSRGISREPDAWQDRLKEAVDGVSAVLLRNAEQKGQRVVLVSSAKSGEGKTTLAGHMAMSLATAGRRTLLVDFDLRRPALHDVFGLELQPGISEILQEGRDVRSTIQPSRKAHLSVLTAGHWTQNPLHHLTQGMMQSLFDALRQEYDFVVVDGSPVLPVVDTRLIGKYVDSVVLSLLRDVSQGPQVLAACERLESFQIPVLGAVVTGTTSEVYYARPSYTSRLRSA